ncbi:MAG: PD40 domain-containing protein [bacterium]|nr:PD40 domain-containing protein [bacterium]
MARSSGFPAPFRLGPWLIQVDLNRVTGPGGVHQIEPRIMRVLLVLVDAGGGVVTRQDLLDEVWADTVVGEEILTRAVSELRRVFGDDARRPQYIETIRQHGYRLIMPVAPGSEVGPEVDASPDTEVRPDPEVPEVPAVSAMPNGSAPAASAPAPPASPSAAPPVTAPSPPRRRFPVRILWLVVPLLVALVLVASWRWPRRDLPHPAAEPSPLTSYPGRELHPALAPDGTRVAFAWSGPGGDAPGIYVKQRNSETALRLTAEPGWPAWPVWMPDGQSLAFAQTADTATAICLVASLGGPVHRLRTVASLVDGLAVSADGTHLAWAARGTEEAPYRLAGLALADPDAPWVPVPPTGAIGDVQPRFSPDGKWLAWVALEPGGAGAIHRAAWPGGRPERVVNARGPIGGLAWTPTGNRLVYAAATGGRFELWVVAAGGGPARQLLDAADLCLNPTIAVGTGDLAWEQVRLDQDIWGLRTTGREPLQFETAPFLVSTRWEADADLDPATGRVVFVSQRSGKPALWVAGRDGTGPVLLAEVEGASLSAPRWSPDGTRVAFRAVGGEGAEVMVVAVAGGRPRTLPLEADDALPAGWTRDGRALLVAADLGDGWQVHRIDPVDASRQTLTREGGLTAAEAADGLQLYHTRPGRPGLWRLSLAPGATPELLIPGLPAGERATWRLVSDAILWVLRTRGAAVLMRHDLATGVSLPLAELPGYAGGSLAVSDDGLLVLFAHAGEAGGDLMVQSRVFAESH